MMGRGGGGRRCKLTHLINCSNLCALVGLGDLCAKDGSNTRDGSDGVTDEETPHNDYVLSVMCS